MKQEDRKLLLIDLYARLPYGIKFKAEDDECIREIHYIKGEDVYIREYRYLPYWIDTIKPYLRPMSSMTEEEKRHISKMMCLRTYDDGVVHDMNYPVYTPYYVMEDCLSYLRSIHMDYSGLIEKGLAIEAKEGMYEY